LAFLAAVHGAVELVRRFPHHVAYLVTGDVLHVLAIAQIGAVPPPGAAANGVPAFVRVVAGVVLGVPAVVAWSTRSSALRNDESRG
jgi:hypothetical protein